MCDGCLASLFNLFTSGVVCKGIGRKGDWKCLVVDWLLETKGGELKAIRVSRIGFERGKKDGYRKR